MASVPYPLGRGVLPSLRLNLQHYIWHQALGYDLHPDIPVGAEGLRVADIATGTGLWACELSTQLPNSSQLHGFDVSSDQFIPATALPPNVQLSVLDSTKEVPEEFKGRFDVVHIRMVQSVVKNSNQAGDFVRHAVDLLRPGGHMQWDELDLTNMQGPFSPGGGSVESLQEMADNLRRVLPPGWISELPQTLSKHRAKAVAVDDKRELPWQREIVVQLTAMVFEEYAAALQQSGSGTAAESIVRQARGAVQEARQGSYFSETFHVVVGQKSS